MLSRLLIATAVTALTLTAGYAQTSKTSPSSSTATQQNSQNIPQTIRQKLSSDGFTNIQVVPGSYLVSAKDKNGDPVMMVIGPHSMTIMAEVPGSSSSTTGSNAGSSSQSGNSSQSAK